MPESPKLPPQFPDVSSDAHVDPIVIPAPKKRSLWQKLGGTSLTVSVIFHGILVVIGLLWIYQIVTPPEKIVDFMPTSGGGGRPSAEAQTRQQRVHTLQPQMARTAAQGAISNITLPDPDDLSAMPSLGGLSSGMMSGGLGGTGSGGGRGSGTGMGFGAGSGLGRSDGQGTKNPFGALTLDRNALAGTFYDLKQTRDGKPNNFTVDQAWKTINEFTTQGWRDLTLNKFFQAPQTLYQSKLYIPVMDAKEAPAAFNVADKVQPSRWVIVYRGTITPPHSGRFRFVGFADDVLVVRFNSKNVFDHGYYSGTTDLKISSTLGPLKEEKTDRTLQRRLRRNYPMDLPLTTYTYDTTKDANRGIGGAAVGPVFEAEAGREYPIDILLSELPGGLFSAALMIMEEGATYKKAPNGSPILPLFRLDNGLPSDSKADNAPPYDPAGPVWRMVSSRGRIDI